MTIGVIDYDAGNLRSVETALEYLKADFIVGSKPEELKNADKIIFPGVGHARQAMENLKSRGLDEFIKDFVKAGNPLLGICVGSQIILEHSEEGDTPCLGLVPGIVRKFQFSNGLKIPHMGWNTISIIGDSVLLKGVPSGTSFYFVHSYYPDLLDTPFVLAAAEYGCEFSCGMVKDNLAAFQFHPEKSAGYGLRILDNFISKFG